MEWRVCVIELNRVAGWISPRRQHLHKDLQDEVRSYPHRYLAEEHSRRQNSIPEDRSKMGPCLACLGSSKKPSVAGAK